MPTSLGQNGVEGHGSFGEDPYQLLGKGLEADHDQLFVVVAVTGAVICPDMHDDVLCVCPRRLVQQAGCNVSRCGSSNCSDMQVASGVKPPSVHMSKVGVASQERREPALLWQSQCRRRLSGAVQSWGVGCGRGNSVCYSRRRSMWSAGCGNGLWSAGCGNGLWSVGCGNVLWSVGRPRGTCLCSAGCGRGDDAGSVGGWQKSCLGLAVQLFHVCLRFWWRQSVGSGLGRRKVLASNLLHPLCRYPVLKRLDFSQGLLM